MGASADEEDVRGKRVNALHNYAVHGPAPPPPPADAAHGQVALRSIPPAAAGSSATPVIAEAPQVPASPATPAPTQLDLATPPA